MHPYTARELFKAHESKKPVFMLIGALLIICAVLVLPLSGMLIYYGTQDELDLGGTMTLRGKVIDSKGENISQARVTILNTGLMDITDSEGNFEIQNAPQGIWKVRVSLAGYKQETLKLILHRDWASEQLIELTEGQGTVEHNDLWILFTVAALQILFLPFIVAGSYYAFSQTRIAVVFVGGVLGAIAMTLSFFFPFFTGVLFLGAIGFILSTSVMIFTVTSRKDFSSPQSETDGDVTGTQVKEPALPSHAEPGSLENQGPGPLN